MKKFALMGLAAGMVLCVTGTTSAQYYDPGYRDYPRYRDYDRPDCVNGGITGGRKEGLQRTCRGLGDILVLPTCNLWLSWTDRGRPRVWTCSRGLSSEWDEILVRIWGTWSEKDRE